MNFFSEDNPAVGVFAYRGIVVLQQQPQAKPVGKGKSGSDEAKNKDLLLLK
jgi:hypothetical protein